METLPSANGIPVDLLKAWGDEILNIYQWVPLSKRKPGKSGYYYD